LAFERRNNPALSLGLQEFVDELSEGIPAKPAELEAILRFNQGRGP